VGSPLRSDDVAGLEVARAVARRAAKAAGSAPKVLVLEGSTAPENFTGCIFDFKPSHIVVVDCAELGAEPGGIGLFPIEDIGGVSSNTHSLPLSVIFGYLRKSWPCEILVLGIQPKSLAFDGKSSKEVRRAIKIVAKALIAAVKGI
jgi:hydrogenase 3 maturation protease